MFEFTLVIIYGFILLCVQVQTKELHHIVGVFGIRRDHIVSNVYEIHWFNWGTKEHFLLCGDVKLYFLLHYADLEKKVIAEFSFWNVVFCMKQWQAVVLPLCLTSLMYAGSIFDKCLLFLASWGQHTSSGDALSFDSCKFALQRFLDWLSVISSNILVWRNYVVVSTIVIIVHVEP